MKKTDGSSLQSSPSVGMIETNVGSNAFLGSGYGGLELGLVDKRPWNDQHGPIVSRLEPDAAVAMN